MNKAELQARAKELRDEIESQEERQDLTSNEKITFTEEERAELRGVCHEIVEIEEAENAAESLKEQVEEYENDKSPEIKEAILELVETIDDIDRLHQSDNCELIEFFEQVKDDVSNEVYED